MATKMLETDTIIINSIKCQYATSNLLHLNPRHIKKKSKLKIFDQLMSPVVRLVRLPEQPFFLGNVETQHEQSSSSGTKTEKLHCRKNRKLPLVNADPKPTHKDKSFGWFPNSSGMFSTLIKTIDRSLESKQSARTSLVAKQSRKIPKKTTKDRHGHGGVKRKNLLKSSPKAKTYTTMLKFLKDDKHLQSKLISTFSKSKSSPTKYKVTNSHAGATDVENSAVECSKSSEFVDVHNDSAHTRDEANKLDVDTHNIRTVEMPGGDSKQLQSCEIVDKTESQCELSDESINKDHSFDSKAEAPGSPADIFVDILESTHEKSAEDFVACDTIVNLMSEHSSTSERDATPYEIDESTECQEPCEVTTDTCRPPVYLETCDMTQGRSPTFSETGDLAPLKCKSEDEPHEKAPDIILSPMHEYVSDTPSALSTPCSENNTPPHFDDTEHNSPVHDDGEPECSDDHSVGLNCPGRPFSPGDIQCTDSSNDHEVPCLEVDIVESIYTGGLEPHSPKTCEGSPTTKELITDGNLTQENVLFGNDESLRSDEHDKDVHITDTSSTIKESAHENELVHKRHIKKIKRKKYKLTMPAKRRSPMHDVDRPRVLLKISMPKDIDAQLVEADQDTNVQSRELPVSDAVDDNVDVPIKKKKKKKKDHSDSTLTRNSCEDDQDGRLSMEFAKHNWFLEKYKLHDNALELQRMDQLANSSPISEHVPTKTKRRISTSDVSARKKKKVPTATLR